MMNTATILPEVHYHFTDTTARPGRFFNILPEDWRESIVPFWPNCREITRVYTLEFKGEVLGGGLVFSDTSPDTVIYGAEARHWFSEGYLYIGFVWIAEAHRGKQLGSEWLKQLFSHYPKQKFWLAIEEEEIARFYEKNGFYLVKQIKVNGRDEWILVKD